MKGIVITISIAFAITSFVFIYNSTPEATPQQYTEDATGESLKQQITHSVDDMAVVASSPQTPNINDNEAIDHDEVSSQDLKATVFDQRFLIGEHQFPAVSKQTIDDVFANDFQELFNEMRNVEYTEQAEERKIALENKLLTVESITSYELECAASVCALEFSYSGDDSENQFAHIAEFAKNYSFEQYKNVPDNEDKVRAVYIATDDPSKLQFSF
ncbi:hypothetical protein [Pseudoalteromonas obscura]|uniref:Uncharacterized protein n=1 Tax=Pseudoalteromonas obscura TaxID=3048491 RepID=A0ABT7EHW6_9GAMM|nr:hypothetical protein [Pseudoalteromonas sp. P94(2023)]MDK2594609.1 hypothetical protein [Pseudoalteromonas sp. P94(2023)]